jgi:hypothetical protein
MYDYALIGLGALAIGLAARRGSKTEVRGVAWFLRPVEGVGDEARLYKLFPPLETFQGEQTQHVVVMTRSFDDSLWGRQYWTHIYPSDETGKNIDRYDQMGSVESGNPADLDFDAALRGAGYEPHYPR